MTPPWDMDIADGGELTVDAAPPELDAAPTTLADLRHAFNAAAHVLAANEPRHRGRWRTQPPSAHVAHALDHLKAWRQLSADGRPAAHAEQEPARAFVRCAFALELLTTATAGRGEHD